MRQAQYLLCNSGNGRRDFFYDDDDDNEFRAVSRFFRAISTSFISLTRTPPTKTAGTTKPSWKPGCANNKALECKI